MESSDDSDNAVFNQNNLIKTFIISSLSGGLAGLSVDVALYPIDSFKTRLQSASGFWASGGFTQPYAGISAVVISSIPSAALFFAGYETTKQLLLQNENAKNERNNKTPPIIAHMLAAGIGEVSACLVRVPSEVIKQRTQARKASSVMNSVRFTIKTDGLLGLYRGFGATVARDVPFGFIQYPLWEILKDALPSDSAIYPALAGYIAGGVTAAVTTPLDVAKTRIMLTTKHDKSAAERHAHSSVINTLLSLWQEGGTRVLFAGVGLRVFWISIGGAIFLGSYDYYRNTITSLIF